MAPDFIEWIWDLTYIYIIQSIGYTQEDRQNALINFFSLLNESIFDWDHNGVWQLQRKLQVWLRDKQFLVARPFQCKHNDLDWSVMWAQSQQMNAGLGAPLWRLVLCWTYGRCCWKARPRPWQNTVLRKRSAGFSGQDLNGLADTSMRQTSFRPLQLDYGLIREV